MGTPTLISQSLTARSLRPYGVVNPERTGGLPHQGAGKNQFLQKLSKKICEKRAVIGVIGLGYVGLPLAAEFGKNGFSVCGFDVDFKRIKFLKQGKSYVGDVDSDVLGSLIASRNFKA